MGVNPMRSRRCERRVSLMNHWETGKGKEMMKLEPEDLPMHCCAYHEDLVSDSVFACYL